MAMAPMMARASVLLSRQGTENSCPTTGRVTLPPPNPAMQVAGFAPRALARVASAPAPRPVKSGVPPPRKALYAPESKVPHGENPPASFHFATAARALTFGSRMFGLGGACVPLDICHSPQLVCVPLLSSGFRSELQPPDSAMAIAAATGDRAAGPPLLIHKPCSWAYVYLVPGPPPPAPWQPVTSHGLDWGAARWRGGRGGRAGGGPGIAGGCLLIHPASRQDDGIGRRRRRPAARIAVNRVD